MKDIKLKKKFLRGIFGIFWVTVLLFSVWFLGKGYRWWLEKSETFRIQKINIQGNELLSEKEVLRLSRLTPQSSIWQVNLREAADSIKSHVFVENVRIERRLPDILCIRIKEKSPLALLHFKDRLFCIDRKGMVLPSLPGKVYDLPVVSGDFRGTVCVGSCVGGEWIRQTLEFLRCVLYDQPKLYCRISEVIVGRPKGMVLYLDTAGIPVWVGKEGYARKIRYLAAVMEELIQKKKLSDVRYIDLRFAEQVVIGMRT